ncbi:DUF6226 family protein [Rhodococcus sp. JS3073]|uniref:DUF6226 family protein n=1 Tax=Rhodococcus sp. JS3073 TaxID=3002901 RepID=UPI0022857160|nr:DUF6226 family protein [Rhodococcus sp. JS3073]WAM16217.1 DUF6226 family protein [Rhodococcus sp. JS3073]
MEDPPEDAYGRVTNPERFASLIPAAEVLIADLGRRFDVVVDRGPAPPSRSRTVATLELVTITPVQRDQAPLTITFTSFPGLYLRAGAWQDFALPACGCDACEEDAEDVLRELAEYAEALTAGRLSERITGRHRAVLEFSWEGDDWRRHGTTTLSAADVKELRARPVQPPADGHWWPWSPRR